MPPSLSDAEVRRIYIDALERALRHAGVHVPRDEAREIAHHIASALVTRRLAEVGTAKLADMDAGRRTGIDSIDAFVHRAVLNRLRELWRAKRRRKAVEQFYHDERTAVAPAWTRPDSKMEARELHDAIEIAIAALPETRRQVFLLIRRDQRSYKEVAEQLGISVGTVHTHLSRANASLRHAVAEVQHMDHIEPTSSRIIGGRS